MRIVYAVTLVIALIASLCPAQEVLPVDPTVDTKAEPVPAVPAVAAPVEPPPPPPIPDVTPDLAVFKRSPVIDGQIQTGEWDQHFTFDYGELRVWTYVNWDDSGLYVASKSTQPTDLLLILDANADGWFHGSDNYEFTARRGTNGGSPILSVSRYDSHGKPEGAGVPQAAESSAFTMKAGSAADHYVYELAIPKASMPALRLGPGRKIGIKVAVGTGGQDVLWIPTAPLGEAQSAEMVAEKTLFSDSLKVTAKIADNRIAPGEDLVTKITVKNVGDTVSAADAVVVGGEGKTAKLLGSQLIRLDGLQPGKSFDFTFKTPVPRSAEPGSGAIGIEVRSEDKRLAAQLASFDIVPAYEVKLDLGSQPIKRDRHSRVCVVVKNNTRKAVFGRIKLSLPEEWKYRRGDDLKEFYIRDEDTEQAIVFRVKPPADSEKRAPVLAEVQIGGNSLSASGVLEVE